MPVGARVALPKKATTTPEGVPFIIGPVTRLLSHRLHVVRVSRGGSVVVVGCWLLVVGCWLLVVGCWLLVVGCWLLVVGCWLLVVGCCCCCCLLFVVVCLLFVVCCLLFVVGVCLCVYLCIFVFFVSFTSDAEACSRSTQTLHELQQLALADETRPPYVRVPSRVARLGAASPQLSEVTRFRFVVALVNATSSSSPSVSAVTVGCLSFFGKCFSTSPIVTFS